MRSDRAAWRDAYERTIKMIVFRELVLMGDANVNAELYLRDKSWV